LKDKHFTSLRQLQKTERLSINICYRVNYWFICWSKYPEICILAFHFQLLYFDPLQDHWYLRICWLRLLYIYPRPKYRKSKGIQVLIDCQLSMKTVGLLISRCCLSKLRVMEARWRKGKITCISMVNLAYRLKIPEESYLLLSKRWPDAKSSLNLSTKS